MNYGKALRIARAIAGVEQKQLASEAGFDASHISLLEKGARQPSVGAIAKLCRALQIPEPLFNMLAAESADLRGLDEQEFELIGTSLTRFLINRERTAKRGRPKRSVRS
jgi:transcriptional regulator with XRE-family HTH domain